MLLYDFFIFFGYYLLFRYMICKYFFQFSRRPFHFVNGFCCCVATQQLLICRDPSDTLLSQPQFSLVSNGNRITVTSTPKDLMRIDGLEEVRVFCGPLSFMSTKRIDIEARSIPPLTRWPPCPALGLVPLVASGQWEGGCPPLPRGLPWSEESWHS